MGIVLDEAPHTSETAKSAAGFVTMNDTELGHADGKLLVTSVSAVEDQAVTGAVHGFQGELFFVDGKDEHVFLVMLLSRKEVSPGKSTAARNAKIPNDLRRDDLAE